MTSDPPQYRPLERFWPYAELPEQPTAEEVAALDPDLYEALFGVQPRPFSITLVFPALDMPEFARALDLARASAEFRETGSGASRRYRARFWSSEASQLRDLFQIVPEPEVIGRSFDRSECGLQTGIVLAHDVLQIDANERGRREYQGRSPLGSAISRDAERTFRGWIRPSRCVRPSPRRARRRS